MEQIRLSDISSRNEIYDVLLCCSSFEERCMTIPTHIRGDHVKSALICHYYGPNHKSDENFKKLTELFTEKYTEVKLHKNKPLDNYDALFDAINGAGCHSVLLDISTFTKETLLIALMLFRQNKFSQIRVKICYTPAAEYPAEDKDGESKIWLTRGVYKIRSVLGFSGYASSLKDTMLIVLVGFETERAKMVIDEMEPEKLFLGYAPPVKSHSEEIAKINYESFELLTRMFSDCERFEFSCKEIEQTKEILAQIIEANIEKYNIIISPMSNKISTIATGIVAFDYPDVQVCYASTNQYNTMAYSKPADYIYMLDYLR